MNRFSTGEKPSIELLVVNEVAGESQRAGLFQLRASRNGGALGSALDKLRLAAAGSDNLVPHILDGVEAMATVGEISDALRSVFGEYREAVVV